MQKTNMENGNGIKALSLFDGVSCGQPALERAGVAVSSYDAFEIDRYAIAISRYNYPDIRRHGDVMDADFSQFQGYDLLMGGSPCTFWSIARKSREVDTGGMGWALFMRFAEAVRVVHPRFFLYENVASMPQGIRARISEELGCEPTMINSALVSAQQRRRLYWTNIKGVAQPEDRGIMLRDILESGASYADKSHCMTVSYCGAEIGHSLARKMRTMVFEPVVVADKAYTICAQFYKENVKSLLKRNKKGLYCAHKAISGENADRIYSVRSKTVSLAAGGEVRSHKVDLPDGDYTVRKLTPTEAERCQTMPDGYTALGIDGKGDVMEISNTQRYKCVGNGWTVDVIAHILKNMEL